MDLSLNVTQFRRGKAVRGTDKHVDARFRFRRVGILSETLQRPSALCLLLINTETGQIKQQEAYDRMAALGIRFDVSSHWVYGCCCSCFCFGIV